MLPALFIGTALAQDAWQAVLDQAGRSEADLGFEPKGYWARYPRPGEPGVPYVLPAFADLLAEPVRVHDHALVMGELTQRYMVEERADHGLARTAYVLGIDRLTSGFRAYWEKDYCAFCEHRAESLDAALAAVGATAGPDRVRLAPPVEQALADLVLDLAEAHRWVQLSFRNVDPRVRAALTELHDLEETQADGEVYHPELDDLMKDWDIPSFLFGAQLALDAVDRAGTALAAVPEKQRRKSDEDLSWATPLGPIAVLRSCPEGGQQVAGTPGWITLELAGCDTAWEHAALATPSQPVSVALDLGGDDTWGRPDPAHSDADHSIPQPDLGAGLGGVAVLWDGAGRDSYTIDEQGEGFGQGGAGFLVDREGDDTYVAHHMAQGAAWFGLGMLFDEAGADHYHSITSSQASAGSWAVGALVDVEGDDVYRVEPSARVAGLEGDYHSGEHILGNSSQGVAMGRRGDLTDGHSWAGGLGTLVDLGGDDVYEGGNWVQGVGYWYGMGFLYDRGGNDHYRSVYFSTASGAHFAIGALVDRAGDDVYELLGDPKREGVVGGAGLAFGWDYVVSLLLDTGGNDSYRAELLALGCANVRSVAIFADVGGDDTYRFPAGGCGLGATDRSEIYADPLRFQRYSWNDGFFVDLGGKDTYLDFHDVEGLGFRPATTWGDDRSWGGADPAIQAQGTGLDAAAGTFWGYGP